MIPEWGLVGAARVLEIKPCPEIRPGPGRLVLMKSATRYTGDMATLTLAGSCDAITGTAGHPIFSIDRAAYVHLGDLMPGERVRTADGWATVEAMSRWRGEQEVYNLEVDGEHRFFVGGARIESHNASNEKTCRIRHYTNKQGIEGIKRDGEIKARDQNKVFAERADGKPLSPRDAEAKYQIGRGRGNHMVETDVSPDRVTPVFNKRTREVELQIDGNVKLSNPSFYRNDGSRR